MGGIFLYGQDTTIQVTVTAFAVNNNLYMSDNIVNNTDDLDLEYTIVVMKQEDILSTIDTKHFDVVLMESIITGIERNASESIKDGKVAQLPSIGCVRKSPIRQAVRANHENFREARKKLTKEEYKDHVREFVNEAKNKQKELDRNKVINKRLRSKNKKKYDLYHTKLGRAHAELYLASILWLKEIPYDPLVQEHFNILNGVIYD